MKQKANDVTVYSGVCLKQWGFGNQERSTVNAQLSWRWRQSTKKGKKKKKKKSTVNKTKTHPPANLISTMCIVNQVVYKELRR